MYLTVTELQKRLRSAGSQREGRYLYGIGLINGDSGPIAEELPPPHAERLAPIAIYHNPCPS